MEPRGFLRLSRQLLARLGLLCERRKVQYQTYHILASYILVHFWFQIIFLRNHFSDGHHVNSCDDEHFVQLDVFCLAPRHLVERVDYQYRQCMATYQDARRADGNLQLVVPRYARRYMSANGR